MSELGKFIAFKATVELIKDDGNNDLLQDVYQDCIAQADLPASGMENTSSASITATMTSRFQLKLLNSFTLRMCIGRANRDRLLTRR